MTTLTLSFDVRPLLNTLRSTRAAPTSLKLSMGAEGAHLLMVEMALASDGQEL
jgi:hypothetical protein